MKRMLCGTLILLFLCRSLNSGQTNGLLVGNAVSRIASEIILCSVDSAIKARKLDALYCRYVDDYFIFAKSSFQINEILAVFRQELAKFGLTLNESKLQINESPFSYGKPWVEQMRAYAQLEPHLLLEKSVIEYHRHKDVAILKYALKVIRTQKFNKSEWKKLQPTIISIWTRFPNLSSIIIIILKNNSEYLSATLIKQSIYAILDTHIPLKDDEEVIWAIWASKTFNVKFSQNYIKQVLSTDNWLAIIILLDVLTTRKGEESIKKILISFRRRLENEYFSENTPEVYMHTDIWLLAYEVDKNKWLNLGDGTPFHFARKHSFFKELRTLGVDFYQNGYVYEKIGKSKSKSNIYVTRKELFDLLREYKEIYEIAQFADEPSTVTQNIEDTLYDKIVNTLANSEDY